MRFFDWVSRGGTNNDNINVPNELHLDQTIEGTIYIMVGLEGGSRFREKIYSMGLNPGVKFSIIQNSGHGPIEIEVRQTKLAIGRTMAAKIKIKQNGNLA